MEKRVLLAVTLSFVVLVAYQAFFVKPVPRRPATATPAATAGETSGARTAAPAPPPVLSDRATPPPPVARVADIVGDAEERDILVESRDVRAVFTNRGAQLKVWELKRYFDDHGQPIDLFPDGLPERIPHAFALVAEDADLTQRLQNELFKPSALRLDIDKGERDLVFELEDSSGLKVQKHFVFAPDRHPYLVDFSASVTRNGTPVTVGFSSGPGIGDTARAITSTSFLSPSYYLKPQALVQRGRKVQRLHTSQLAAQPVQEGVFTAAGMEDQYFLAAVLPGQRNVRMTYETKTLPTAAGPRDLVEFRARVAGGLEDVKVFLGPKQYDILAATDRELVRTINFGIFDWLVVPLLQALNWIHRYIGNYGWSIILLTILINGAIAPLRHRSMVSMRKMQEIQPQVKAIQERYANLKTTDPARQKMNVELMSLYREKGVNPASGCLPMLLTMPVLFAFYSMLSQAIELRGAPFLGWIHDLSAHDPYYVTPLLMGASMVWQQRLTPTTADPVQQKVMMFMPLMFTFMFLWAPSGLVLYWLMSNVWAIGQQYVTNRLIGPPRPVPAVPAADRPARKTAQARAARER